MRVVLQPTRQERTYCQNMWTENYTDKYYEIIIIIIIESLISN